MLRPILIGLGITVFGPLIHGSEPASQALLAPRGDAAAITQVSVQFHVGGDLILATKEGQDKVPISVVANLTYHERKLPVAGVAPAATDDAQSSTIRHYEQAEATIKIGEGGVNLSLPDERRLIIASNEEGSSRLDSPIGPLTREQLDLIDVPASTQIINRLLPGETKQVGDTFRHDDQVMGLILGLDDIDVCEVESVLIGIEKGHAKLRLSGIVQGTTDGAATELDIRAGYLFNMQLGRITRMNLAFTEKRKEGRVGPAVDVVGKLTLALDPQKESKYLTDEVVASVKSSESADRTLLLLEDKATGLRVLHDRKWYVTSQERERLVLRRIDGEFVAQCNIALRPERKEGRQSTLREFENDVRFSLGDRLESLVTSREWTNASGLRCYRIVVHGQVDGLPMEWRNYLVSPSSGRSVALSVSVEPQHAQLLGEADLTLVESMQFVARSEAPAAEATISNRQETSVSAR